MIYKIMQDWENKGAKHTYLDGDNDAALCRGAATPKGGWSAFARVCPHYGGKFFIGRGKMNGEDGESRMEDCVTIRWCYGSAHRRVGARGL